MRRKKKSGKDPLLPLLLLFMAIMMVAFTAIYFRYEIKRFVKRQFQKPAIYGGVGISLPSDYRIHGIDISRYQEEVNWYLVKNMDVAGDSLYFVFIKATEGVKITDPYFKYNWKKAGEAGFVRGAYHFFRPEISAREQARHFIDKVDLAKGDLPPVLDLEVTGNVSRKALCDSAKIWLDLIEAQYEIKPIIYSGKTFYRDFLQEKLKEYPLWIAHYYQQDLEMPEKEKWHFWQHNDQGRVNGIRGFVDYNVFNGSKNDLLMLCKP